MVTVFDTSAVIAGHATGHPQFAWADARIREAERPTVCTHSLAECYGVLTRHPVYGAPPREVATLLASLAQTWTVLPLTISDYLAAVRRCRELGLQGGAIYDTLLAQAALSAGAAVLVTLNPKHFHRLGEDISRLVVSP